jgi:F-type H+-transporting ATPase subunit epsilon
MADRTFTVDVVTPERVVISDEATSLVAPGGIGSFGVLPNHAPMLSELGVGELRYRREGGLEVRLAVGGGFIQIFNNEVTVLADAAERAEEIDVERARRARDLARDELRASADALGSERMDQTQQALDRALNRIRVAGG